MIARYQNHAQRKAFMVGLSCGLAMGFGVAVSLTALARLMGL